MLAIRTITIATGLFVAATAVADEADVHLELVDEATIASSRILLGDVARLRTGDPALSARLETVPIGRVLRVDSATSVSRHHVMAGLERWRYGFHRRVTWSGPARTTVRALGHEVPLSDYAPVARAVLEGALPAGLVPGGWKVALADAGTPVNLPAGRVAIVAQPLGARALRTRTSVLVTFEIEGELITTRRLWFDVEARAPRRIALRDLERHTPLRPEDIGESIVDLAALGDVGLPVAHATDGMRTSRRLRAGAALRADDVEPTPPVASGQEIVVVAAAGRVAIEAGARALEDGILGERIRVESPSGRRYDAIVTGPGRGRAGGGAR